jgi:peptidoglycan/LPS O-acetylase OafA/YrhL
MLSCAGGLAAAMAVGDIAEAMGLASRYRLHLAVIAGGALAGIWQARILRAHVTDAWIWIPASILGWSAAAAAVAMADGLFQSRTLGGALGALVYLGLVVSGGLLLGVITGVSLRKLFERRPKDEVFHL